MRKTLNINLGGLAFIIDENAFELLHNYLEALKLKFNNQQERDEIMNDIESRIAEMLTQKIADRKEVVGIEEVQVVMDTMGRPEDIAGEEGTAETTTSSASATNASSASPSYSQPVQKKLYRDPDDAKVGGVISGLCHYFGIHDPVWIRIAAIILIIPTSGMIILIYFLLILVVPKALTAADKLQMKGEPINIKTIEKEVRDAATKAGESFQHMVSDQNFFQRMGDIVVSILKVFLKVGGVFVLVFSCIALVGILLGFLSFYMLGTSPLKDASLLLVENLHTITLFSFGFLLAFGTPVIAAIYISLKAILGQRSQVKWLKWTLLAGWSLGMVLLVISVFRTSINFKEDAAVHQQIALVQPATGTITVVLADSNNHKFTKEDADREDFSMDFDGLIRDGVNIKDLAQIRIDRPDLQLVPSENDSFYVQEVITSQGRNRRDAEKNANMVIYSFSQSDSVLRLSPYFYIPKNGKWRGQDLKIHIAIPQGKQVKFADNIDLWHATVKGDSKYDDTYFAHTAWTVDAGKVKCISGENHKTDREESEPNEKQKEHTHIKVSVNGDKDASIEVKKKPVEEKKKEDKKDSQDF